MKQRESFMITRAKIWVMRASGVRRLLTFLSQMRRLFKDGAYSSKYGNLVTVLDLLFHSYWFEIELFAWMLLLLIRIYQSSVQQIRKLKQQRRQLQRKHHLKKIGKWWLFFDYCFFLSFFIVDRARCKWTGRSAVEVNVENETFCVAFSHCR